MVTLKKPKSSFLNEFQKQATLFGASDTEIACGKAILDRFRREAPHTHHPLETAVCVLYLVCRGSRPGTTLSDYTSMVKLNAKAFTTVFRRLEIVAQRFLPTWHHDPRELLSAHFPHLFGILKEHYHCDYNELWAASEKLITLLIKRAYNVGRHPKPLVCASMVMAALSFMKSPTQLNARQRRTFNHKAIKNIPWSSLCERMDCSVSTIQRRFQELATLLCHYASVLPHLKGLHIAKTDIHCYAKDILPFALILEATIPAPHSTYVPSFDHLAQQRTKRAQQITHATDELGKADGGSLDTMDTETQLIYLLLAKDVPVNEVEFMSMEMICRRVADLYNPEPKPTPKDLDRIDVDEQDMSDQELDLYTRPTDPCSS